MCKSKRLRLLSLLFSFLLLFASLSLNVSAASENLIDSDLSNWENLEYDSVSVYSNDDIYRLSLKAGSGYSNSFGVVYDLPSFVAGHSYSLSFKLPSGSDIASAWGVTWTDEQTINYYNNSTVIVGYGFLSADGTNIESQVKLYEFNSSNISNYLGKTLKTSFVAGSASGRPVVYITFTCLDANIHHFYFSDFVMFDNDDNSQELTGIKGFLHSIRWDLVGGVCEEEDCPHSSDVNPHLSLTERMSAGFSTMFENIGNKFEEGSTLNLWFNDLSDKFSALGDREEGFFSNLGDRMSGFFDNLKSGVTSGFSDVGSWFTNLGDNLSSWFDGVKLKFQEVGDGIKQKFQEIADKFTEFFDKFKPRVFVNLKWVRGLVNWNTGELMLKDDNSPYVVVSELFEVPHGTKYLLDFVCDDVTKGLAVHKYDLNGNFIRSDAYSKNFEAMELESGYCYRFRTQYTTGVEDLSIVNDYVVLYSDEGWINALLFNMKMGIKNLFVPDEDAILVLKNDLDECLKNHLGIIYTSTTLIGDFTNTVFDMVFDAPETFELMVPEVSFSISGEDITLWKDIYIDLSFMETEVFEMIYGFYTIGLYILFGVLEVKYAIRVYRRMMAN